MRKAGLVLWLFFASGCVTTTGATSGALLGFSHPVRAGETLWSIADRYEVSLKEIARLNGIQNPSRIASGSSLWIPAGYLRDFGDLYDPRALAAVERIAGPRREEVLWRTITVHHSATEQGNAEIFHNGHRERNMGGLFYHFVIGNGRGAPDGAIEVGWRWGKQAQVKRSKDIQICLVGDFTKQYVSEAQFRSLMRLTAILRRQYFIPVTGIRRHLDVDDHTECPGKNFPYKTVLAVQNKAPMRY